MADTMLDIVDDNDNVIGQALRSEIHAKGLLHREIHVWFITPDKKVIFQRRSKTKDTNPGMLTIAVGGHVEQGATADETALIETREETGLSLQKSDLYYLGLRKTMPSDVTGSKINHALRSLYGYLFKGKTEDLLLENGESEGFIVVDWNDLVNPSQDFIAQATPGLLTVEFPLVHDGLEKLIG